MTSGWAEPLTTRTRSGRCSPMKFAKFPERRRADLPISPPSALPNWLKNRGARCSFQCSWTSSAIRRAAAMESESAILKATKILFSGGTAAHPWPQAQPKRSPSSAREGTSVATAGGGGVRRSSWACVVDCWEGASLPSNDGGWCFGARRPRGEAGQSLFGHNMSSPLLRRRRCAPVQQQRRRRLQRGAAAVEHLEQEVDAVFVAAIAHAVLR